MRSTAVKMRHDGFDRRGIRRHARRILPADAAAQGSHGRERLPGVGPHEFLGHRPLPNPDDVAHASVDSCAAVLPLGEDPPLDLLKSPRAKLAHGEPCVVAAEVEGDRPRSARLRVRGAALAGHPGHPPLGEFPDRKRPARHQSRIGPRPQGRHFAEPCVEACLGPRFTPRSEIVEAAIRVRVSLPRGFVESERQGRPWSSPVHAQHSRPEGRLQGKLQRFLVSAARPLRAVVP